MRKGNIKVIMMLVTMAVLLAAPLAAVASETMTVTGEVNDNFQIVDGDGQIYEVADTDMGNTLTEEHIGDKAKVTGTVAREGDLNIITVIDFEVLAE
jgi:hypothetical protein